MQNIETRIDLSKDQFDFIRSFFDKFGSGTSGYKKVSELAVNPDGADERGIRDWYYWYTFVYGYQKYAPRQILTEQNPYVRYLIEGSEKGYPGTDKVPTDDWPLLSEHVSYRFKDFFRAILGIDPAPISVVVSRIYENKVRYFVDGQYFQASLQHRAGFDGIHRCFSYKFWGQPSIPAILTVVS